MSETATGCLQFNMLDQRKTRDCTPNADVGPGQGLAEAWPRLLPWRRLFSMGRGKGLAPICDRGVLPWMRPGEGDVGATGGPGPGGAAADPGGGPGTVVGGVTAEGERCTW